MSAFNDCLNCTITTFITVILTYLFQTNVTRIVSGGVVCDFDEIKLGLVTTRALGVEGVRVFKHYSFKNIHTHLCFHNYYYI